MDTTTILVSTKHGLTKFSSDATFIKLHIFVTIERLFEICTYGSQKYIVILINNQYFRVYRIAYKLRKRFCMCLIHVCFKL